MRTYVCIDLSHAECGVAKFYNKVFLGRQKFRQKIPTSSGDIKNFCSSGVSAYSLSTSRASDRISLS